MIMQVEYNAKAIKQFLLIRIISPADKTIVTIGVMKVTRDAVRFPIIKIFLPFNL